jgi:hypothetical protein
MREESTTVTGFSPAIRDGRTITDGLVDVAASQATHHRPQHPAWHWRVDSKTPDLHLDRSRVLAATDPDTRLATLSCSAALHHARSVLGPQAGASPR